jgi:hypothetical protein
MKIHGIFYFAINVFIARILCEIWVILFLFSFQFNVFVKVNKKFPSILSTNFNIYNFWKIYELENCVWHPWKLNLINLFFFSAKQKAENLFSIKCRIFILLNWCLIIRGARKINNGITMYVIEYIAKDI